jgi:hypothetical protein
VAHRAQRIAYLVRDARAQASERGELGLLHAFGDQRCVLEKNQYAAGAQLAETGEMGLYAGGAVC